MSLPAPFVPNAQQRLSLNCWRVSTFWVMLGAGGCATAPFEARHFEVQGHRGTRWARPENTLSAFRYALEVGVDTLEMDLQVTQDDVLVVAHDAFVNPKLCVDGQGRRLERPVLIRNKTLAQLKAYDCGTLANHRFPAQARQPGEKIPALDEVLDWLGRDADPRAKTVLLNIETKIEEAHPDRAPPPDAFARLVIEALKAHGVLERATLQSFDFRTLTAARRIQPEIHISALIKHRPMEPLTAIASRLKANIVSPHHRWLSAEDVRSLHAMGVRVIPWTANTERDWRRLARLGVDGIISDDPRSLLEFRRRVVRAARATPDELERGKE